jgi:hypothetical protein
MGFARHRPACGEVSAPGDRYSPHRSPLSAPWREDRAPTRRDADRLHLAPYDGPAGLQMHREGLRLVVADRAGRVALPDRAGKVVKARECACGIDRR